MGKRICLFFGALMMLFASFTLQACFEPDYPYGGYYGTGGSYASPGWGSYDGYSRQAHEEREWEYGPKRTVCDRWGNNCMTCDADNDYCRRTSIF